MNISSLLFGSALPADWSLLGGYVRSASAGPVTTTLFADGRPLATTTRHVPADVWAFAAVELTADSCRATLPTAGVITLQIKSAADFDLDDVMLVDNRRMLVGPPATWMIEQIGLSLAVRMPGRAPLQIASPAAAEDGWAVEEANAIRLRLRDATGRRQWTLLADARSVVDGRLAATSVEMMTSHATPAEAEVDAATGRIDRETPGDADNDGYNECRAAYQVVASSPRLRMRLIPRAVAMLSPVLEVRGLPAGAHSVTVDGRLIDQTARLADGTLLIMVPLRIETPVEITIGMSDG